MTEIDKVLSDYTGVYNYFINQPIINYEFLEYSHSFYSPIDQNYLDNLKGHILKIKKNLKKLKKEASRSKYTRDIPNYFHSELIKENPDFYPSDGTLRTLEFMMSKDLLEDLHIQRTKDLLQWIKLKKQIVNKDYDNNEKKSSEDIAPKEYDLFPVNVREKEKAADVIRRYIELNNLTGKRGSPLAAFYGILLFEIGIDGLSVSQTAISMSLKKYNLTEVAQSAISSGLTNRRINDSKWIKMKADCEAISAEIWDKYC